jgi:hypothetical protein
VTTCWGRYEMCGPENQENRPNVSRKAGLVWAGNRHKPAPRLPTGPTNGRRKPLNYPMKNGQRAGGAGRAANPHIGTPQVVERCLKP